MWDRIIRGARVVDPKNGFDGIADVAVEDGRVAAVGTAPARPGKPRGGGGRPLLGTGERRGGEEV